MISFLTSAIKIVFLLGFLIFIHESGHFLIAKISKIKVREFSIGFGPIIWKKQGKQTKYSIRLIPLGGFVNMLGEEERSEQEGSFSKASIPKRIAVVIAGGTVNIIFGLLVYFILVSATGNYISTTIDTVVPEYITETTQIQEEDKILKINGKAVRLKSDVEKAIQKSNGNQIIITIQRNNKIKDIKLTPVIQKTKTIGIYLGVEKDNLSSKIKSIYSNSPAEKIGLQVGDNILSINGIDTENDPYKIVNLINQNETEEITIEIERNDEKKTFNIMPQIQTSYKLGVIFKIAEKTFFNNVYYGFWDTLDFSVSILDNVKMLFTGKVGTDQLMGPIGISEVVSKTQGLKEFIYMLALISLSLGVTNLLPFPPLDGGKIVILIIEAIRKKPIKENIEIAIQMAGFCLLIGLSLYITYNDIVRIF
ncbi:MAG: RIP metalloprotease RseP [Clostridia bacterium]|nr:RIP metalloprotease RseP [Clostridia bacterium]